MTTAAGAAPVERFDDALARRNALLLSVAQAFCGSAAPVAISLGGLAGIYLLGPDKSLATAPVTGYNIGVAVTALPAALLMARIGRRHGFVAGALVGIAGALTAAWALALGSFFLFCLGLAGMGVGGAFTQQFRFAATDEASPAFRPKAIAWVLAGGVFAAIIGPQTAIWFRDLFAPVEFAGAYFASAFLVVIGIGALSLLRFTSPADAASGASETEPARPLGKIARQPRFVVAVLCAVGSYALMSYVMTGAPLAMVASGITTDMATLGIQWHVMAMFAPSFFTGSLIARFGKERIVAAGLTILAACGIVGLSGVTLGHFWIALVLLGIGWNFGFIGATAMLAETHRASEKGRAQGLNDLILFSCVAFASLMSGQTLNAFGDMLTGWDAINWAIFPVVLVCLAALGSLRLARPNDNTA